MNRDVLETQWPQVREILSEKFSNLTEEDIRQINGRYDQLVAKLQQKYGYSREEAEERIRSWNFDRTTNPRGQVVREDRLRKEEDSSSILKWLLAIGLPLLLLGAYFFNTARTPENTTTGVNQEQIAETPADRTISSGLRNSFLTQQNLASELQNVQITTHDGVVTLSGFVSNREVRDSLVNSAQNFSGVTRVINNLQVR
jgi:uncharacterized protein YjbJ (UPF0337 family)